MPGRYGRIGKCRSDDPRKMNETSCMSDQRDGEPGANVGASD